MLEAQTVPSMRELSPSSARGLELMRIDNRSIELWTSVGEAVDFMLTGYSNVMLVPRSRQVDLC